MDIGRQPPRILLVVIQKTDRLREHGRVDLPTENNLLERFLGLFAAFDGHIETKDPLFGRRVSKYVARPLVVLIIRN